MKSIVLGLLVCSGWASAQDTRNGLDAQIQKTLNAVPGYGTFDFLTFKTDAGKVNLQGQVTTADLKNQAANAVRALPGVAAVENNVVVAPLSKEDAEIGKAVSESITRGPSPSIYAKDHSIHILVKNGQVTLEGTVHSEIDRTLIASAALGAGNVFGVMNHLVATAQDSDDAQWRRNLEGGTLPSPIVVTPSVSPGADK